MNVDNTNIDYSKLTFISYESMVDVPEKIKPFDNIAVCVSGGSDSDVVIDLLSKTTDRFHDLHFVFFDTGMEYKATKRHLDDLEHKYGITIERRKAIKPIPICCREFGQPFVSKRVSDMISRLQRHNFAWEDDTFENLYKKYPKCKASLRWWCNDWGDNSRFNIAYNKWLKEFMIANPPDFAISEKCCDYAKKNVIKQYNKEHDINLDITGVRKSEGGARATAYKNCLTQVDDGISHYRPIWWYKDEDKSIYDEVCGIVHSDCYTQYGMRRTGCAGCPFGQDFEKELNIIQEFEPQLFKAVNKIFGKSYEYSRKYKAFVEKMNNRGE